MMIMGHVWFGAWFDRFIHGFHMPMFFFISGFLFRDRPESELKTFAYIRRKVRKLLLPYCIWGSVFYIIWMYRGNKGWEPLWHLFFDNTSGLPIAGALWFLTAIFGTEVIYFLLNRYLKNKIVKTVMVVFIVFAGTVATKVSVNRLPYALDVAFVGVGLYHIGYLIKVNLRWDWLVKAVQKCNVVLCSLLGCLVTVLIFRNGIVNMRQGQYANIFLFWINAVGGSWVGLNLVVLMLSWKNRYFDILVSLFGRIGRDSIVYLCLNELVISEVWRGYSWLIDRALVVSLDGIALSFLIFLLSISFLVICDLVVCQTKLKVLVGR